MIILMMGCSNTPAEPTAKPIQTWTPAAISTPEPIPKLVPTVVPMATPTLGKEALENETPGSSACILAGGEVVQSEWSGKDTGPNYCNSCQCMNGRLTCTEMYCMPMIPPTVIPPQ